MKLRLQTTTGGWQSFDCSVVSREYGTEVSVPEMRGRWIIGPEGMIANVGGNDWRIYTLHPDDCKALCNGGTR